MSLAKLREAFFTLILHEIRCVHGMAVHEFHDLGFTFTLHETRCVHDSMNRPKIEFIT